MLLPDGKTRLSGSAFLRCQCAIGPHDVVIFAKLLLSIYRKGFKSLESIFFSDKDKYVYQPLADIFIEITARSKYRFMFSSRV